MVLEELGGKIAGALAQLSNKNVIDEKVLQDVLKEIATALLQADVNVKHVLKLREDVKAKVCSESVFHVSWPVLNAVEHITMQLHGIPEQCHASCHIGCCESTQFLLYMTSPDVVSATCTAIQ
jgi:signal recognition particle GTPase